MGCCGAREDEDLKDVKAEQKWDYITLSDFNNSSCWAPFSFFLLFLMMLKSFAVYGVDTFTAVNLLIFSRWASQIKPKIPFHISKWIFAGCIILSFVLLIYRWLRAIRVMKSGGIAQCYLDPIAARVQCLLPGSQRRCYRRFLVFADLTKSKKGADYVALFTYFNFEAWLRVIFAEGPRQVINGITLYSVMQLSLIPQGELAAPKGTSPVAQFFINIEALAEKDTLQAVIFFAMLFTLVIWVIEFLCLVISVILYLLFLWHHIPTRDGSLSTYCRRKINTRLERIVKKRVDKALNQGVALQDRQRTDLETGTISFKRQPTLPMFDHIDTKPAPEMPGLSRQTTVTTLPPYSRSHTLNNDHQDYQRQPKLPDLNWDEGEKAMPGPNSHYRQYSEDDSPLIENASGPAYAQPTYYQPSGTPMLPPIERYGTPLSLMTGPFAAQDRRTPGPHSASTLGRKTPGAESSDRAFGSAYSQQPHSASTVGYKTPGAESSDRTFGSAYPQQPSSAGGRRTPANSLPSRTATPGIGLNPSRTATPGAGLTPSRTATPGVGLVPSRTPLPTMPAPSATPAPHNAYRNFTHPSPTPHPSQRRYSPPQRTGTAPPQQPSPDDDPLMYNKF
ncbi:hypothetical protein FQN57_001675 [Myotisia sp. PD_48]|nr:hypothetical protein FQN57_001675 [Myotisia sp. PD_48]